MIIAVTGISSVMAGVDYTLNEHGALIKSGGVDIAVEWYTPSVVRIQRFPASTHPEKQSFSVTAAPEKVDFKIKADDDALTLSSEELTLRYEPAADRMVFLRADGSRLLEEKSGSSRFVRIDDHGKPSYRVAQTFVLDADEPVFGLGQHRHGLWNQRNSTQHLRQENMEIAIPMVQSPKGYALFWDNCSPTDFTDNAGGMTFDSRVGDMIDYYFIYGATSDGVIARWRGLTGHAPMYPLWSFGFSQSRERYRSQDELVDVVKRYRSLGVPLDGIVQDWQYWGEDHHYWNAVEFLNPLFPDPKRMMDEVHALNAHAVISIWPSFGPSTSIFKKLEAEGKLMGHMTFPQDFGTRVYNPFDSRARDIYWGYIKDNMVKIGMDGWWLDATEPEHSPIKEEDYDYETGSGTFRRLCNAFPLVSVGGVYDSHRRDYSAKRVFILTRSAFAGQQRYGAQSWSGDIEASWTTLRRQIPAALNFSLCGIPYWNSDIGGFYTRGDYPDNPLANPDYRKLYTRWMQFAAFTGMMRSHGTNCPREIFNFGSPGDEIFDAQAKAIRMRYRFIPYIYSTAWEVTSAGASLMRPLYADYGADRRSTGVDDQFLFGRSVLVAPVVTPQDGRKVYLPAGNEWIDFWTGRRHKGASRIVADAPVDIIPLYIKAGSIIPVGPDVQYASEKPWDDLVIRIYPGADAEYTLYEDEGDNYNYEKGSYSLIRFKWNDADRTLTVADREGSYKGMLKKRRFMVSVVDETNGHGLGGDIADGVIKYNGRCVTHTFKD